MNKELAARERAIAEASEKYAENATHSGLAKPAIAYAAGARAHSLDHPVIAQMEDALAIYASYMDGDSPEFIEHGWQKYVSPKSAKEALEALEALSKARREGKP